MYEDLYKCIEESFKYIVYEVYEISEVYVVYEVCQVYVVFVVYIVILIKAVDEDLYKRIEAALHKVRA